MSFFSPGPCSSVLAYQSEVVPQVWQPQVWQEVSWSMSVVPGSGSATGYADQAGMHTITTRRGFMSPLGAMKVATDLPRLQRLNTI